MAEPNQSDILINEGVTFNNLRAAIAYIYFGKAGMTKEEWCNAMNHVVPMQHNLENPIAAGKEEGWKARDTFIEYWIDEDDRITQDAADHGNTLDDSVLPNKTVPVRTSTCVKASRITLRFLGTQAEAWAKLFHHITRRGDIAALFFEYCNAQFLEYPGPIRPMNVDYFGIQNTAIAFDISFVLQYEEIIAVPVERLGLITVADGDLVL